MRVLAPMLSLEPDRVVVTARFESAQQRFAPTAVRLWAPRALAGRLDVTATPFAPIAAVIAAAIGEDVTADASASPATVAGATLGGGDDGRLVAGRRLVRAHDRGRPWPRHRQMIRARGHGAVLLAGGRQLGQPADPAGARCWHTTAGRVGPSPICSPSKASTVPGQPAAQAAILTTVRRVAATIGLPLVEVGTDARDLLDPIDVWDRLHGAVLAAFGLLLSPLLHTVTIAGSHSDADRPHWGSHVELDHQWSSESTRIGHHLGSTARVDKVAIVAGSALARESLLVCWESGEATNCGRCPKCLRTMTALQLAGGLERSPRFPPVVDPGLVRASRHDSTGFVSELVDRLPPGELRAAWQSHLPPARGWRRLAGGAPPMAGLSALARVNLALAPTGWRAEPTTSHTGIDGPKAADEADADDELLVLGWEQGMVPLRPMRGTERAVADALAGHRSRPFAWVLADEADRHRVNDPGPAALADAAERCLG